MIHADNLWKHFRRNEALRGLSFEVPEGSAFALIGANGAGKSTAIKVLMNILEPSQGSATVIGTDSRRLSPRELQMIGYVAESQELPERLTVEEYLNYLRPFYPNWDKKIETETISALRLPRARRIGELSHGMRMKMSLACGLCYRPKLLILDEPFSGLDPLVRDEVMASLAAQAGETTILIASHELDEIDSFATHVGFLDDGKLLFEESMADLTERFRQVRVTLEREASTPARAPRDWLALRSAGTVVSFVDAHFSEDTLGDRIRGLFGGVRGIEAQPMNLRAIFTTLAAQAVREGVD